MEFEFGYPAESELKDIPEMSGPHVKCHVTQIFSALAGNGHLLQTKDTNPKSYPNENFAPVYVAEFMERLTVRAIELGIGFTELCPSIK